MIHIRPPSSMRAALNSRYSMRAFLRVRELNKTGNGNTAEINDFKYHEGEHVYAPGNKASVASKENKSPKMNIPEVIVTKTPNGKRWSVPAMEVELNKDLLEVRDGLGKIVDAVVLNQRQK